VNKTLAKKKKYFVRNDWEKRVNPALARKWSADRSLRQVGQISNEQEQRAAFKRAFKEASVVSQLFAVEQSKLIDPVAPRVWGKILGPLEGEGKFQGLEPARAYATNPEATGFFRMLVFLKHGLTFRKLILDIEKNHSEYLKLIKVHRDYYRMLTGKKPLGGLRLKFSYDHFALMVEGLDFGLRRLNEFELAVCLDEICPCAQRHSIGYLKKLRALIKRSCEMVISSVDRTSWSLG
jgi:hypothetical protein